MNSPIMWHPSKAFAASAICILLFAATGCIPSWHLQTVSVSGPLYQPAVHLNRTTNEPGFRIDPWLTVTTQSQRLGTIAGHTMVNATGQYQLDSVVDAQGIRYYQNPSDTNPYQGKNFVWRLPVVSGGASFDLDIAEEVALFGGLGITSVDNNPFWSAHAGLGYNFGTERIAGRIDGALTWETIATSAQFAMTTDVLFSNKTEVQFFTAENRRMRMGGYGALTLQSTGKDLVFYTQVSLGTQGIASFSNPGSTSSQDDNEYIRSLKFVSITPGVAWSVGQYTRVVAGIRFISDTEISQTDSPFLIVPLAQLEISF